MMTVEELAARLETAEARIRAAERRTRIATVGLVATMTLATLTSFLSRPARAGGDPPAGSNDQLIFVEKGKPDRVINVNFLWEKLEPLLNKQEQDLIFVERGKPDRPITRNFIWEKLEPILAKTEPLQVVVDPNTSQRTLRISDVNVQIVSSSQPGTVNGRGNLILGHNAKRVPLPPSDKRKRMESPEARTGSHNLILGDENGYSATGGIVVGSSNDISARNSSVLGGVFNRASGPDALVLGGTGGRASKAGEIIAEELQAPILGVRQQVTLMNTNLNVVRSSVSPLVNRVVEVEKKTAPMEIVTDTVTMQPTLRISNVNVQIVSGSGATFGEPNGRGNLILGYNEIRPSTYFPRKRPQLDKRSGSHFLILGRWNGYEGFSGIVGGFGNAVANGKFSSALGGTQNLAMGGGATVSGGEKMVATDSGVAAQGDW